MKQKALDIINFAVRAADPYKNTAEIISAVDARCEKLCVMSIGKAAVPMAKAAADIFGGRIYKGLVVTKYRHSEGFSSPYFKVIEAGHPVSDENSLAAAEAVLQAAEELGADDICLVLLSGGGSALLEKSRLPFEHYRRITEKLLSRGADIEEINCIRRRLSFVKGGALAQAVYPAKVITVALSDVLSNDKKTIASGITVPDDTSDNFISDVFNKYLYDEGEELKKLLYYKSKLPINSGGYYFAGNINILCSAAEKRAAELGLVPVTMSRAVTGEAVTAAEKMLSAASPSDGKHCYIFGGETTVTLRGSGTGGRNQEMALYAAVKLRGRKNIVFASAGSDGTDGPTDAAGGIADGDTYDEMVKNGVSPEAELENNNSYFALKSAGALIMTGPTGTNVNDISVIIA